MKLWLDDIRPMPEGYDVHVKTAEGAIMSLQTGMFDHISFDHDLGDVDEKTGYDVAKWIEKMAYYKKIKPMTYAIHSANPIGATKIKMAMRMADQYWGK
jgi:hypothetical protein